MTGPDQTTMIDGETLARWMDDGVVDLYDVREHHEYMAERIPGSRLLPLSSFDPTRVSTGPGRSLVLHCKSGVRCGVAAEMMRRAGYRGPIHRLEGGILAWKAEGRPTGQD